MTPSKHEAPASVSPAFNCRRSVLAHVVTALLTISLFSAIGLLTIAPLRKPPPAEQHGAFFPAAYESAELAEPMRPGWLATYGPVEGRSFDGGVIRTHAPSPSFALMSGETLHPVVPPVGMTAAFNAAVRIPEPGTYRFLVEGEGGRVEINITGPGLARPASAAADAAQGHARCETAWLTLPTGEIFIRIGFTRSGDKPARLRAMWQRQGVGDAGFAPEPIPVTLCSPPPFGARDAETGLSIHRGRVLLAELGCVSCHEAGAGATKLLSGPDLTAISTRADPAWLLSWIENPHLHKPATPMPRILTESRQDKADAKAILHYLMSVGPVPEPSSPATERAVLDLGESLYHSVGCVACHGPIEGPRGLAAAAPPPVPHGNLKEKWHPAALSAFLRDPLTARPSGKMPSMNLTHAEADALATYLTHTWGAAGSAAFTVDQSLVAVGRAAFTARGCASCHSVTENAWRVESTLKVRPLADVRPDRGCLRERDARSPRYALTPQQRADLTAAIDHIKRWGARPRAAAPIDMGRLTLDVMQCRACHESCGVGGPSEPFRPYFHSDDEAELGDEGRFPPVITDVGAKLTTSWLRQVMLEGGRARPYMRTRMPQFGRTAVGAAHTIFPAAAGVWPDSDLPDPVVDSDLVQAGRRLVGVEGLNCISCHVFGNSAPAGTPGPDIAAFAERLRYEWWLRYVMAPERIKPGTRMPAFYMTGQSPITDVLAGDPHKQAQAMWAYFTLGEHAPAPDGLPRTNEFEVRVGDRPAVVRVFLRSAGSRAIAVGYPAGLHFAFDAERVRLVEAWRGAFLDTSAAWAGRGGQTTDPQGTRAWVAPAGPALVIAETKPAAWPTQGGADLGLAFRGYSLDAAGAPTFMYDLGDAHVEERFEPTSAGQILRTFRITNIPANAMVWLNTGPRVNEHKVVENVAAIDSHSEGSLHLLSLTPRDVSKPVAVSITINP